MTEDLAVEMGVELHPMGWGFKNPEDPRIKEAGEIAEEVLQKQPS